MFSYARAVARGPTGRSGRPGRRPARSPSRAGRAPPSRSSSTWRWRSGRPVPAGSPAASSTPPRCSTPRRSTGWSRHLLVLLEAVAANPRPAAVPAAAADRGGACAGAHRWSGTAAPVPAVGGVHELVERPGGGASRTRWRCVAAAVWLSYGELEARANRLAALPAAAWASGGRTLVGLCLRPRRRHGGGDAGGLEGGWRVRADGPGVSRRTAWLHVGRQRRAGPAWRPRTRPAGRCRAAGVRVLALDDAGGAARRSAAAAGA